MNVYPALIGYRSTTENLQKIKFKWIREGGKKGYLTIRDNSEAGSILGISIS